jgi:superfamily II RNA helicase
VLRDLGYIKDGELTPKGRFAASVQGYEVHAAEFLESGLLHACDAERLVLLFCSIVFEERRGDVSDRVAPHLLESIRRQADHAVNLFRRREFSHGLEEPSKELDWKMSGPALIWARGCEWEDLAEHTTVSDGDLVRCLRMAIQVMRHVRHALHHMNAGELDERLGKAIHSINRDVVDAKRQLELG